MEMITELFASGKVVVWVTAALSVIGGFRVITTMTPNKTDDKILNGILKFLNFFSGAIGKNKV